MSCCMPPLKIRSTSPIFISSPRRSSASELIVFDYQSIISPSVRYTSEPQHTITYFLVIACTRRQPMWLSMYHYSTTFNSFPSSYLYTRPLNSHQDGRKIAASPYINIEYQSVWLYKNKWDWGTMHALERWPYRSTNQCHKWNEKYEQLDSRIARSYQVSHPACITARPTPCLLYTSDAADE